jgi:hypothetical protein
MTIVNDQSGVVAIGIDAGVVAAHQVAVRGPGIREDFRVTPTLAGLAQLSERLRPYAGSLVVAEPTAGTWLPLSVAVTAAGCRIGFVANRDSARLRQAIAGANKSAWNGRLLRAARCVVIGRSHIQLERGADHAQIAAPGRACPRRV